MEAPLIYTSKGNVPIESLQCKYTRQDTPGNVVLVEEYFDGEECVKRSVHVCPLTEQQKAEALAGQVGG